jgi:hypothetical protein
VDSFTLRREDRIKAGICAPVTAQISNPRRQVFHSQAGGVCYDTEWTECLNIEPPKTIIYTAHPSRDSVYVVQYSDCGECVLEGPKNALDLQLKKVSEAVSSRKI